VILRLKRTPGIYLVGFMGCGKTTIGRLLADELGWAFVDLDDDIEARQGVTISEIFDVRGEAEFRRVESDALGARVREIEAGHAMVLALGGGAFAQPGNLDLVRDNGISIWLDCPFAIVEQRVRKATHRPLARDPARFAQLFQVRRDTYNHADFHIEITGDDPTIPVQAILRLPIF
jgi:shikimate kinase